MSAQSTKLRVVENITRGFFDPITLASEIEIALHDNDNAKLSVKDRRMKALSLRVGRARQQVIKRFCAANAHVEAKLLTRRNSKNHPVTMHACLLGKMVDALYPFGDVHVDKDDALWLLRRAPTLPGPPASPAEGETGASAHAGCRSTTDSNIAGAPQDQNRHGPSSPTEDDDAKEEPRSAILHSLLNEEQDVRDIALAKASKSQPSGAIIPDPDDTRGPRFPILVSVANEERHARDGVPSKISSPQNSDVTGLGQDETEDQNRANLHSMLNNAGEDDDLQGAQEASYATSLASGEGTKPRRWWTEVTYNEVSPDFGKLPPPWDMSARPRLVTCSLPHNVKLTLDPETGLVRATDICMAFDRQVVRWLLLGANSNGLDGTISLANALASDIGTTPAKLVYVANGKQGGTWVHIHLIVDLASWCCKPFALHVSKVVMRYHSGQMTAEDSRGARTALNCSLSDSYADTPSSSNATQVVPTKSPAHRLVRTTARSNSRRAPDTCQDVPIPRHLMSTTGVYAGAWGIVKENNKEFYHFKVGIAPDQPVTCRIKAHYAEKPATFVLLFIAGCDSSVCRAIEWTMKHLLSHILGLPRLGNSDEEYKVPVAELEDILARLGEELRRRHSDVLTFGDDLPINNDLEKHRVTCEYKSDCELRKFAFEHALKMSDEHARDRAIASILNTSPITQTSG